jgi:hypothetical protein
MQKWQLNPASHDSANPVPKIDEIGSDSKNLCILVYKRQASSLSFSLPRFASTGCVDGCDCDPTGQRREGVFLGKYWGLRKVRNMRKGQIPRSTN